MPLYEFQCLECGEKFEKRLPFAQSNQKTACSYCPSERTIKLLGTVAILSGNRQSVPSTGYNESSGLGGGCACGGGGCGCH